MNEELVAQFVEHVKAERGDGTATATATVASVGPAPTPKGCCDWN